MRLDFATWLYGLLGDMIRGGASAVTSGLVVSAMDSKDFNYMSAKWYALMGAVFLVHATLSVMKYLQDNPLPKIIKTTVTEERSEHSTVVTKDDTGIEIEKRTPHSTVVTKTVEEIPIVGKPKDPPDPPAA